MSEPTAEELQHQLDQSQRLFREMSLRWMAWKGVALELAETLNIRFPELSAMADDQAMLWANNDLHTDLQDDNPYFEQVKARIQERDSN